MKIDINKKTFKNGTKKPLDKNKTSIVLCVAIIILSVAFIVYYFTGKDSREIKQVRDNENKATEIIKEYIDLSEEEGKVASDFAGYIIILEKGNGYSDYMYIVSKTGDMEDGQMVNFSYADMQLLDGDGNEIKIYAPDGYDYPISAFKLYNQEEVENGNTSKYIFYGESDMGYSDNTENQFIDENDDENDQNTEISLAEITERANTLFNEYYSALSVLAEKDNISEKSDLFGYVIVFDLGEGLCDYVFTVNEDGTLSQGVKVNFSGEYNYRKAKFDYKILSGDGGNVNLYDPLGDNHLISDYSESFEVDINDNDAKIFYGTEEMGFNHYKIDEPDEEELQNGEIPQNP